MGAERTMELTWDPEVEAAGWLTLSRDAFEGDAFPRARIGDLVGRRGPAARAGWLAGTLTRRAIQLVRRVPWPFRT